MSKCVNCQKEINEKEVFCLTCHEEVLECAKNQIADLEAKLADMERCAENNKKVAELVSAEHNTKIEKLEQQLVEKEKEIEKLNACVDFYKSYYISFKGKVIDELEKVKSAFGLINPKLDKVETIKEYIHYIDHQINELKGKVENVKD